MYDSFTDRARKVMQLANQEAQRFNHEYIGTEHVLLALIKEGSGIAANVLKSFELDFRKIRLEVERLIRPGPAMVTMGKLPQTPQVQKVIEYAIEESSLLRNGYVGTEHLLLGLIRVGEGAADQVLTALGMSVIDVREEVINLIGIGPKSRSKEESKDIREVLNRFAAGTISAVDAEEIIRQIVTEQTPGAIKAKVGNFTLECGNGSCKADFDGVPLQPYNRILIEIGLNGASVNVNYIPTTCKSK